MVPGAISVLARHGLLEQWTRDRKGFNGMQRDEVWSITALGTTCLQLLEIPIPKGLRHPLADLAARRVAQGAPSGS